MEALRSITKRSTCPGCRKSVKYFCYHCLALVEELEGRLPTADLPLPLTILMDHRELDGKSTAVYAHFSARPGDCSIVKVDPYDAPGMQSVFDSLFVGRRSSIALLFPCEDAKYPSEVDWSLIDTLVAIDGTWSQASTLKRTIKRLGVASPMKKIVWVKLRKSPRGTKFWRHQHLGPHYFSTIEAIHELYSQSFPGGDFGALLVLFGFFYELIQQSYREHPKRQYTSRHAPEYIVYSSEDSRVESAPASPEAPETKGEHEICFFGKPH